MTQTRRKSRGSADSARHAPGAAAFRRPDGPRGASFQFGSTSGPSSQLAGPHQEPSCSHSAPSILPEPPSLPSPEPYPRYVGNWELCEQVAEGSWAQVFLARPVDTPSDRPPAYAVKMMRPDRRDHPQAVALIVREALAGRSLSHPHVIAVLDSHVGQEPRFLVMPWLNGTTLEDLSKGGAPVDLPAALWIARQVAEGLNALHTAGWTHGDVKPSNIHLSPEGHVTLLDLGFARKCGENDSIADRWLMGTFRYLAPEYLATTLRPDIRSDIYSLGVVMYELLSGQLPSQDGMDSDSALPRRQVPAFDLRSLVPQLPVAVVHLVQRMLAQDPLRRPQTPGELVEQLARLEISTFSERAVA